MPWCLVERELLTCGIISARMLSYARIPMRIPNASARTLYTGSKATMEGNAECDEYAWGRANYGTFGKCRQKGELSQLKGEEDLGEQARFVVWENFRVTYRDSVHIYRSNMVRFTESLRRWFTWRRNQGRRSAQRSQINVHQEGRKKSKFRAFCLHILLLALGLLLVFG